MKPSTTGVYKYDSMNDQMVRIDNRGIPDVGVFDCYVPDGGYYSDNLECFIESREHKRQVLAAKGLTEIGDRKSREL